MAFFLQELKTKAEKTHQNNESNPIVTGKKQEESTWDPLSCNESDSLRAQRDKESFERAAGPLNNLDEVRRLVATGVDVNAKARGGWTALMYAAEKGHTDTVKYLVEEAGANVHEIENAYGRAAIEMAVSNGHADTVEYLIGQAGATVGGRALGSAALNGYTVIVEYLIKQAGIDVDYKDNDGWTALMFAANSGRIDTVKYLVEQAGANVELKSIDEDGPETALMMANRSGHNDIVEFLANHGAKP
mmetsp:Transcript_13022/g.21674  ORF Transcript_13022/g.21674 Transcript_13022/m.21674 type:complete len:246 (-) Transcript_13022:2409-3146(-)